jgi:hypothetical protein
MPPLVHTSGTHPAVWAIECAAREHQTFVPELSALLVRPDPLSLVLTLPVGFPSFLMRKSFILKA